MYLESGEAHSQLRAKDPAGGKHDFIAEVSW